MFSTMNSGMHLKQVARIQSTFWDCYTNFSVNGTFSGRGNVMALSSKGAKVADSLSDKSAFTATCDNQ